MLKLSTINLLVESVLKSSQQRYEENLSNSQLPDIKGKAKRLSEEETNRLCICLKAASICEMSGIEAAMQYYEGTHTEDEFQEFRTSVVLPKLEEMKKRDNK